MNPTLASRLAHRLDVFSPPRSISSDGAHLFRFESDSTACFARSLRESHGTVELKIRADSHSTSLRFSPIRVGLPTSLSAKDDLSTIVVARHTYPESDNTSSSS